MHKRAEDLSLSNGIATSWHNLIQKFHLAGFMKKDMGDSLLWDVVMTKESVVVSDIYKLISNYGNPIVNKSWFKNIWMWQVPLR